MEQKNLKDTGLVEDHTLRGFDGGDFKGTQKAVINIENRTRFNDVLGGVVFFDIGRAWTL